MHEYLADRHYRRRTAERQRGTGVESSLIGPVIARRGAEKDMTGVPEDHVWALQSGQIVSARSSEILHLLATRKVPCVGLLRGKTGLAGAIVHLDTLKNAMQAISFSGLTYREMSRKLRVSSPTLCYLLDQGFLTTYKGQNPATLNETETIPQVSIDAFLQQYVTPGRRAEAAGPSHFRSASKFLRSSIKSNK